jgi:type IV pilus assembly protein PilY1
VESGKVVEKTSKPSEWKTQWTDQQPIRMLLDAKAPVVSALSVGYDNKNFWIYGGTGRFYDKKDKTDDGMNDADTTVSPAENGKISYFGIKEPTANKVADLTFSGSEAADVQCKDAVLSWDTVNWDVNSQDNADLKPNNAPGKKGLMQVDNIIVSTFDSEYQVSFLKCITGSDDCFPGDFPLVTVTNATGDEFTDVATFANLKKYIAGEGCTSEDATGLSTGLDGWYREFHAPRERNLGQAALLGGLLTFTSYQPFEDKCNAEGMSSLYGVHFQTGTAWTESVFGLFSAEQTMSDGTEKTRDFVKDTLSLGQGLSTTPSMHVGTGDQAASAFIQTSTGEIIEVKQENLPFGNQKSGRTNWSDQCTP